MHSLQCIYRLFSLFLFFCYAFVGGSYFLFIIITNP